MMPPITQGLDLLGQIVVHLAFCRVNIIGDQYGDHAGACLDQLPQRLVFRPAGAFREEAFDFDVRYLSPRSRTGTVHYGGDARYWISCQRPRITVAALVNERRVVRS